MWCSGHCRTKETTLMTTSISRKETQSTPGKAQAKANIAKQRTPTKSKGKRARKTAETKEPAPARHGGKTAKILDLLKRPDGATLLELTKATGWQAHSVRGFLSGTIGKKMGTPVESSRRTSGERAYRLSK
jgi:hypothetical protein